MKKKKNYTAQFLWYDYAYTAFILLEARRLIEARPHL